MHTDWQSLAALGLGLGALAYVSKRWWPGLMGLFKPAAAHGGPHDKACGPAASAASGGTSGKASCGSGCGNCGHSATPAKDHRIQVVRRTTE